MANATIIYACTSDGLVILTRPGTLPEWLPPRRVLEGKVVTSAWAEPGPPIRVLAVADGELMLSENGGRTWAGIETDLPVQAVVAHGEPPNLLAIMHGGGLAASYDRGTTWGTLPAMRERKDITSIYTSDDRQHLLHRGEIISTLAHDPTAKNLYAAFLDGVRVTANHGASWTTLPGSPADVGPLVAIPGGVTGKPPALVAGTAQGLSVSLDGGVTWQASELSENSGVVTLARDPERRDRLYAGTSDGYLFESGNRGQTWEHINPYPLPPASYMYVLRI